MILEGIFNLEQIEQIHNIKIHGYKVLYMVVIIIVTVLRYPLRGNSSLKKLCVSKKSKYLLEIYIK